MADMAAGFYANAPDLTLTCDHIRISGNHAAFVWTFTGHDAGTNTPLKIKGWEEWDLGEDGKTTTSRGWFDGDNYARQVAGN